MADPGTLEVLITCPVCQSRLTRPKLLPCQHSVCLRPCLEGLVQEGYYRPDDGETIPVLIVKCPTCRDKWRIPEEGVDEFPDSLDKKQLLDAVQEAKECFHCGFRRETRECHHCHHQLCDVCRKEHEKLTTNIINSLHAMVGEVKENTGNKEDFSDDLSEKLRAAIDGAMIIEKIDEAIGELIAVLENRRETLSLYAKGIIFFQKYLLDKVLKKRKKNKREEEEQEEENEEETESEEEEETEVEEDNDVEDDIHVLQDITESRMLQQLQESLAELEKNTNFVQSIGKGMIPDFEYDVSVANSFGKISCECDQLGDISETSNRRDRDFASDEESESYEEYDDFRIGNSPYTGRRRSLPSRNTGRRKTTRSISTVEDMEMVNVLPSNVRYKAKQHSVRTIIDKQPGGTGSRKLQPTCAVYSNRDVVSHGKILELDCLGGGSCLLESPEARALALTESGNLLIMERERVTRLFCIMFDNDQYSEPETIAQFTDAHKICCYGNEFAVLDIGRKYIAKFDEGCESFLSFGASRLTRVDENSQMTVDSDGRLYVTTEGGIRKLPSQLVCRACNTYSRLLVTWQLLIQVFSWQGKFLREICITGTQKYDYAFGENSVRCKNSSSPTWHKVRIEQSVPSDDEMERKVGKNAAGGMCVDSDGYITITRPGRNKIDVYSRTGSYHCSITNPAKKNEFKEPSDVTMMPDGRMIVCDLGNNRILVL